MKEPGREAWFDELYNRYHRAVFAYLLTRVDRRETAKDLLQEVFLRVWQQHHVARKMGAEAARHWIYRIARNLVIDDYRRRGTRDTAKKAAMRGTEQEMVAASAADIVEAKEQTRRLEEAIRRLPADLYQVFVLRHVGEMNSTEIGELLGLPAGTVRYRLSMARELLRRALDGAREEEAASDREVGRKPDTKREPATGKREGVGHG